MRAYERKKKRKRTGISLYSIPFHERLNEENHKYVNISILAGTRVCDLKKKQKKTKHRTVTCVPGWLMREAAERSCEITCGAAGVISERFNVSAEIHNVAATV